MYLFSHQGIFPDSCICFSFSSQAQQVMFYIPYLGLFPGNKAGLDWTGLDWTLSLPIPHQPRSLSCLLQEHYENHIEQLSLKLPSTEDALGVW